MSDKLYVYDEIDYNMYIEDENSRRYFNTGYQGIDETARPRTGEITMIPAFTDHGKSTFLRNLAYNMYAMYDDIHILFYSFEGSCGDTYTALARIAHFYECKVPDGSMALNQEQYFREIKNNTAIGAFARGMQSKISKRIHVIDKRCKPSEIQMQIDDAYKSFPNVRVVFIDYLQDLKSESHYDKGHSEIEQVLENIEDFTKMNNVATIIAAQYGTPQVREPAGKFDFVGLTRVFGSSSAYKKSQLFYSLWNETAYQRQYKNGEQNPIIQKLEIDILKQKGQKYGKNLCLELRNNCNVITITADHYNKD